MYFKQWYHYVNDHVPFKNEYIKQSNSVKGLYVNAYNANNRVIVGKNEWLFYNACELDAPGMNEYIGLDPLDNKTLLNIVANLKALKKWCNANDIVFQVIICPNKQTVYPEYLPAIYQKQKPNRLNQIMELYPEIINLEHIFISEKKKNPTRLLYYKTDSHWNEYGACFATKELHKKLLSKFPYIDDLSYTLKDTGVSFGYDLANMIGLKQHYRDSFPIVRFHHNNLQKIPRIVVVHDSYLGSMNLSLNQLFSEIIERPVFGAGIPTPQELLDSKADVFMIEVVERYSGMLSGNFHPDYYK